MGRSMRCAAWLVAALAVVGGGRAAMGQSSHEHRDGCCATSSSSSSTYSSGPSYPSVDVQLPVTDLYELAGDGRLSPEMLTVRARQFADSFRRPCPTCLGKSYVNTTGPKRRKKQGIFYVSIPGPKIKRDCEACRDGKIAGDPKAIKNAGDTLVEALTNLARETEDNAEARTAALEAVAAALGDRSLVQADFPGEMGRSYETGRLAFNAQDRGIDVYFRQAVRPLQKDRFGGTAPVIGEGYVVKIDNTDGRRQFAVALFGSDIAFVFDAPIDHNRPLVGTRVVFAGTITRLIDTPTYREAVVQHGVLYTTAGLR